MKRGTVSILLLLAMAAPATAQTVRGSGTRTSDLVSLGEGPAVFEADHRGDEAFAVRLLSEQGTVVEELFRATGRFAGAKAFQVPRAGRYVFDVTADGSWSIRVRRGADLADAMSGDRPAGEGAAAGSLEAGRAEGQAAAGGGWSWGWFGRGLAGGLIGGPIGTVVVAKRAGRSGVPFPDPPAGLPAGREPLYARAFQEGFTMGIRSTRREAAIVGGLVGTAAWATIIVTALDLVGDAGGRGTIPEPQPGLSIGVSIPWR